MNEVLVVENRGAAVASSNYWGTRMAAEGKILVSVNAGAFRVLLPRGIEALGVVAEMEMAVDVVVSRGPWMSMGRADALEILFDDRTGAPYALHLTPESFDRLPLDSDVGRPWVLSVWTAPARPGRAPICQLGRPCWYRRVPEIPWLRPRLA